MTDSGSRVRFALQPSPSLIRKRVVKARGSDGNESPAVEFNRKLTESDNLPSSGLPTSESSRQRNLPANIPRSGGKSSLYNEIIKARTKQAQNKGRSEATSSFQRQEYVIFFLVNTLNIDLLSEGGNMTEVL